MHSSSAHGKHSGTCATHRGYVALLYSELSSNSVSIAGKNKSVRFTTQFRDFSFALCDHGKVDSVCLHRSKTVGQYLEYR